MSDSREFEEEPEVLVGAVARVTWSFVVDWGLVLVFIVCCLALGNLLFRKLYLPGLLVSLKVWLAYKDTLKKMQDALEADYEIELWSNPEFCRSYLELYEEFRRFRSMANRDHAGASIVDDRHRQEEAEELFPFFDADFVLHDRLIYAVEGTDDYDPAQ